MDLSSLYKASSASRTNISKFNNLYFGGSFEDFKKEFSAQAGGNFGSGWTWLVADGDKVMIEYTSNADTPIAHGRKPVLTLDVWEHAYYVDYRNARPDYIAAFWNLVNWDFVNSNLG